MTFFVVVGMIVLFVIGLLMICGSVFILLFSSAWTGKISLGEFIPCLFGFCLGVYAWYYLFTHLSINVGFG